MGRRLFCEISPVCYKISVRKEIVLRNLKDFMSGDKIAAEKSDRILPETVKNHSSVIVRRLNGVDLRLQENKAVNIKLAAEKISGIIVHPGEVFSYWKTVGKTGFREGYREGLVIGAGGKLGSGVGGGLCQMANMIHYLILNSPLEVTELHHHSDALFPDERRRVPFGTGTSVVNNYLDYRFRNNTDCDVQILVWTENGELCGELRSEYPFPYRYELVEENHHFEKQGEDFFRISQVYKITTDQASGREISKELVLDNHSRVLYDHSLIPRGEIRWRG